MGPRRTPSPGTVLGVIAVLISLGGSAYAISLSKNSVKSKHIAPNAVKGVDAKESSFARVPNAANATNAGKVDGRDAVCPGGTFFRDGVCFDSAVRSSNSVWSGALTDCEAAGGRLPTITELHSIRAVSGIDLGPDTDGTWADVSYEDSGSEEAASVEDSGDVHFDGVGSMHSVLCAFNLVQ